MEYIITGTHLLSYNTCETSARTVDIRISGGSISFSRRPDLDGSCGSAFFWNGDATIVSVSWGEPFAGSSPDGFKNFVWVGQPSVTEKQTGPTGKYDCVNGSCKPQNAYNTPGFYNSLEECEANCGPGCSGKCISNSDWSKIENLASQLKNKNCG